MQIIAIVTPSKIPDACGEPPVHGALRLEISQFLDYRAIGTGETPVIRYGLLTSLPCLFFADRLILRQLSLRNALAPKCRYWFRIARWRGPRRHGVDHRARGPAARAGAGGGLRLSIQSALAGALP